MLFYRVWSVFTEQSVSYIKASCIEGVRTAAENDNDDEKDAMAASRYQLSELKRDIMKQFSRSIWIIAGALVTVITQAQVPAANGTSDNNENTGLGFGALGGPQAQNSGNSNTATGWLSLNANTSGDSNTAYGGGSLYKNTTGNDNVAVGVEALTLNTTGYNNTGTGTYSLLQNTTGFSNTAYGFNSLSNSQTSSENSAFGAASLQYDSTGYGNVAVGYAALYVNTTGYYNSASGYQALYTNSTGYYNTATGYNALYSNTEGFYNTATGYQALYSNTTGQKNFGDGVNALYANTTGGYNTGFGVNALGSNTTGSYNIGEGYHGGYNLTTGSYNIDIGNPGLAAESGTIRIGTEGTQTAAYVAGVYGTSVSGNAVYVSSTGKLGVVVSSERFKTGIEPLDDAANKLQELRPVRFHLKTDPHGPLQYGLIAEEVAKVYPDLVIRDATGRIDGVRYDELAPLLLDVVQHQQRKLAQQDAELVDVAAHENDLRRQVAELVKMNHATQAALRQLQALDRRVASR